MVTSSAARMEYNRKREGAIITAYTGIMLCNDYDSFHKYIEELLGRPIYTHEIPLLFDEIKEKSTKDFMAIIENQT